MKTFIKNNTPYFLLILILSAFSFRILFFMHFERMDELAMVSYGPITGEPFWRAFQNRLLGPFLIDTGINLFGISIVNSFKIILLGTLIFANSSVVIIFKKLGLTKERVIGFLVIFNFLFLILQDHRWIMIWDPIDIIIFLWFFYGLIKQKSFTYFTLLFLIALFNRESALFIALWFILDGIYPVFKKKSIELKKLLIGSFLMVTGILYTWWIRTILFKKSMIDYVGKDLEHVATGGNHINFMRNLEILVENIVRVQIDSMALVFVGYLGYLFIVHRSKLNAFMIKGGILTFVMFSSIWFFGIITETRQYLYLIPFVLISHWYFYKNEPLIKF